MVLRLLAKPRRGDSPAGVQQLQRAVSACGLHCTPEDCVRQVAELLRGTELTCHGMHHQYPQGWASKILWQVKGTWPWMPDNSWWQETAEL